MENKDIRRKAKGNDIPMWKIANRIGISEPTLTRWMRTSLNEEHRRRIEDALDSLIKEGER